MLASQNAIRLTIMTIKPIQLRERVALEAANFSVMFCVIFILKETLINTN